MATAHVGGMAMTKPLNEEVLSVGFDETDFATIDGDTKEMVLNDGRRIPIGELSLGELIFDGIFIGVKTFGYDSRN